MLVIVNALVGAVLGLERTLLPQMAESLFGLSAKSAVLSFIVVFGVTKAVTNYFAGRYSDRFGRKQVLILGWVVAIPAPFLLMWATSWNWILLANLFLGVSQGLTWSTTVIMKIDLVGPSRRGLAMGINEFAGYFAIALSALLTGYIANRFGFTPEPFYLGIVYVMLGLCLSVLVVKETIHHVSYEAQNHKQDSLQMPKQRDIFLQTTFTNKNLSSITQAGLVNNLNDGLAWGLFPLFFAAAGMQLTQVAWLAAIYPATWGLAQLFTGALSDRLGRKWLIASGMWLQAGAIALVALSHSFEFFAAGAVLLGIGTALVYPTLLAAIGDSTHPTWRATSVGIYRFWRDLGYAVGAVLAGVIADYLGMSAAILVVAALTFASGTLVAIRMRDLYL